jgi:pimeloyl-ACP methyl ester carboxylesterase
MAADVPKMLTRGHEREYATWMLRDFTHPENEMTPAFEEDVLRTYAEPAALKASFELYRTAGQDAADFAPLYGSKLAAPVLALGGEQCFGDRVIETFRQVAGDVSGGVVERASHFVPMERPDEVTRVLGEFIGRTKIDG